MVGSISYGVGSTADGSSATFYEVGHERSLAGAVAPSQLPVVVGGLALQHGEACYVYVQACDVLSNCAIVASYPMSVDHSTPRLPLRLMPDMHAAFSPYWTHATTVATGT